MKKKGKGGQAMTESVMISLEHYKELEAYKRQYEIYQDVRKDLVKIIEDKTFSLDNQLEKKIFDLYSKLVNKEMQL